jgi:hypothetical protein
MDLCRHRGLACPTRLCLSRLLVRLQFRCQLFVDHADVFRVAALDAEMPPVGLLFPSEVCDAFERVGVVGVQKIDSHEADARIISC